MGIATPLTIPVNAQLLTVHVTIVERKDIGKGHADREREKIMQTEKERRSGSYTKIKERKKMHDMASESEDTSDDDNIEHDTINIFSIRSEVFTTMDVVAPGKTGKTPLKLKIGTGASGNTLTLQTFRNLYGKRDPSKVITPVNTKLTEYNGQKIPCYGSLELELSHKGKLTKAKFYVVNVEGPRIIGLPTCEKLELVTINCNEINTTDVSSVESLKQAYPGQFDTLGDFRDPAQLYTKLGAEPSINPRRKKCSVLLEDQLQAELEKTVKQGVIHKVKEHTDWCSGLAYTVKKRWLSPHLYRSTETERNLETMSTQNPYARGDQPQVHWIVSIQQDGCMAGYWSVHLDEPSQLLATFRTPFGRYCWKRLPFGLCVSQDIFQARMDEILEDLPGVAGITDDVCVHGKDVQEHDDNLRCLMERVK